MELWRRSSFREKAKGERASLYKVARLAVEKTTPQYDKLYDYLVPPDMELGPGCRVTVPFGAQNRRRLGIVLEVLNADSREGKKTIFSLVDDGPVLSPEQLTLLKYLREHTFCSYFDAMKVLLPAGLGIVVDQGYRLVGQPEDAALSAEERQIVAYLKGKKQLVSAGGICRALGLVDSHPAIAGLVQRGLLESGPLDRRKIMDERVAMVRLTAPGSEAEPATGPVQKPKKLTARQAEVVRLLGEIETASIKEICYYCGFTRAVIDRMEKQGLIEIYQQPVFRDPYAGQRAEPVQPKALSAGQQAAYDELAAKLGSYNVALLYGVTGSGKTQVFLQLVRHTVQNGRQVIVMVPEISLTPQTLKVFHELFGDRVAVLHSSLTLAERLDEYKRIREGYVDVVVGTRSAVFAPLERIGLIVMDEEQERTYKSESAPRYHARDIAKLRCRLHGALLLLSSATPSVESYHHAVSGRYTLAVLKERFAGAQLPDVYMLDMRADPAAAHTGAIGPALLDELYYNLSHGEQSILLLNRRGYNTLLKCSSCGEVATCESCSVALTYHSANNRLLCHYCGYTTGIPPACPHCGSAMVRLSGVGTQRVEEELRTQFADARILRMDMDTTLTRGAHERMFEQFAAGEYDIMIGTQMIAKGLNFPRVTLVGVLGTDAALYSDDFRSCERTFALLTQVVGRSGRAELKGRAYIQTLSPEHRVLQLAATQNYPAFFAEEIQFREMGLYPPFCDIVAVGFAGAFEQEVAAAAALFTEQFVARASRQRPELPLRLLGPSAAFPVRVAGRFRYKLLIKCRVNAALRGLLEETLSAYYINKATKKVQVFIDMAYDTSL